MPSSTMPGAVVAGHICLDIIPDLSEYTPERFRQAFLPGHLATAGAAALTTGGIVANTGLALHKLGIPTQLMGKVGDDQFGEAVRQILSGHGPHLAESMIVESGAITSYSIVISPPGIDRFFLHCPGANSTFSAEDIRYELLGRAGVFHFGYPTLLRKFYTNSGEQLVEMFRRAKEAGVTTSLDMAMVDALSEPGMLDWRSILARTLPYVDIFLPSIEEILFLLKRAEYAELCQTAEGGDVLSAVTPQLLSGLGTELLDMGARIVGFKLGQRGIYLRTSDAQALSKLGRGRPSDLAAWAGRELWAPGFQVDVAGTLGAGDAAMAGFLSALLRDLAPEEALVATAAVGACNVEAADALSGIRPWDEVLARIKRGWPQHSLRAELAGWHYDRARGLWIGS